MKNLYLDYEEGIPPLEKETEQLLIKKIREILEFTELGDKKVNIYFCSTETIAELNSQYRGKKKPTDILSWAYDEMEVDEDFPMEEEEEELFSLWGDLALCLDVCQFQAEQYGWDLQTELQRLLVHGIAHLMGYDHESEEEEKQMLGVELKMLKEIGLGNIYN